MFSPSFERIKYKYFDLVNCDCPTEWDGSGYIEPHSRHRREWETAYIPYFNLMGWFIGPITGPLRASLGILDVITGIFMENMDILNNGLGNIVRGTFEASPIIIGYLTCNPELVIWAYFIHIAIAMVVDVLADPREVELRGDSSKLNGYWL